MPDPSTVHFDVALTNVSIAFRNTGLVAREVAPEVMVRRQGDRYFIHDPLREAARSIADFRAPGTEAREVDFTLSSDSYFCDDHALESALPDEERDNADEPLTPEIDRVEFLTDRILLNQEVQLVDRLRTGGLGTSNPVADTEGWDDTDSDPIAQIDAARSAIIGGVQQMPNLLVLSQPVYTALRNHPKVLERVRYSQLGVVGTGVLAELLDVERVLVARAMRNTAGGGQQPVMEYVWGRDALLLHVPPRPALKSMAAALTFCWAEAMGSSRGHSVQTWREERRKATMIRAQKYYDQKVIAPAAGWLFRNTIAE